MLAISYVSYNAKKEQKLPWLPDTGLLKLDNQDFPTMYIKLLCSEIERFSGKNI
jgi:hypothetical protein